MAKIEELFEDEVLISSKYPSLAVVNLYSEATSIGSCFDFIEIECVRLFVGLLTGMECCMHMRRSCHMATTHGHNARPQRTATNNTWPPPQIVVSFGGGVSLQDCERKCSFYYLPMIIAFYLWHRSRNTWNGRGGGGGGGGGWINPQVLLKNGFLTNCLLFGNTKVSCHNYLVTTDCFYCMDTL